MSRKKKNKNESAPVENIVLPANEEEKPIDISVEDLANLIVIEEDPIDNVVKPVIDMETHFPETEIVNVIHTDPPQYEEVVTPKAEEVAYGGPQLDPVEEPESETEVAEEVANDPVVEDEPVVEEDEATFGPVVVPTIKKGVYRLIISKNPSRLRAATIEKKLKKMDFIYEIVEENGNVLWVSKNFPTKAVAISERKRLIMNGLSSILEEI